MLVEVYAAARRDRIAESILPVLLFRERGNAAVLTEYIEEALERARYELIDDPGTPYYGEVPDLPGVWATGDTLEVCRRELKDVIEGWLLVSVKQSLPIPPLGPLEIKEIDAEAA